MFQGLRPLGKCQRSQLACAVISWEILYTTYTNHFKYIWYILLYILSSALTELPGIDGKDTVESLGSLKHHSNKRFTFFHRNSCRSGGTLPIYRHEGRQEQNSVEDKTAELTLSMTRDAK